MARYAIKIGEVHLRSDKPITGAERAEALRQLDGVYVLTKTEDGLEITLNVDGHRHGARVKPIR